MKPLSALFIFAVVFFGSCQTKQEYFTKEQLQKKTDSLIAIRFQELQKQAAEDLDRRISIEVKPKVDSILEGVHIEVPEMVSPLPPHGLPFPDSLVKDTL